jgi:RNA polymerase primary sigma factor
MAGRTDKRIARYPRRRPRDAGDADAPPLGAGALRQHDDHLAAYLDDLKRFPLLTAAEERVLGERTQAGDQDARAQLIACNLRLVVAIARTYGAREMTLLDLISEGNIGLVTAVDHYQPDKGARFASYAGWWIRRAISRAIADRDSAVPLPSYLFVLRSRVQHVIDTFLTTRGRGPTVAELCRQAGVTVRQLRLLAQAPTAILSLETPISSDGGRSQHDDRLLGETVAATDDDQLEAEALGAMVAAQSKAKVLALFKRYLTQRECLVLSLRLQLVDLPGHTGNEAPTVREVGTVLNLTRQRVQQIESRALAKLRQVVTRGADGELQLISPSAPALVPALATASVPSCVQPVLFGAA